SPLPSLPTRRSSDLGAFFTLYLRLPQLTYFRHAWRILAGKYAKADDPGDTSHFQALSTALSGTVGTGNIGGVGLAIFIGGPAARSEERTSELQSREH